ncbi:hypothetical protein D7X94_03590 [Acutalibacter sp. 1XD8-33]|uniref:hypothetical protein n=1 Tax=Acutalibacter sp. 1XD8-33 TaxID=2320081 RepID=UPI000EA1F1EF|nr:hypothetical protein [Acutalibacter sp. 1XD8-33]RKJ41382.1 hypothetical protein D7X94_03590 [Acutalibacter sp. 1XD8-33]
MEVRNSSFTEKAYQYYQLNQQGKDTRFFDWGSAFRQLCKMSMPVQNGFLDGDSNPGLQILEDYEAWKATQPPRRLPGSQGATEENRAYLREHFSGKLDLFQRLDAADTMVEMGIISRDQMLESLGLGKLMLRSAGNAKIVCTGPVGHDPRLDTWTNFFSDAPFMRADTLDLLFRVLDSGMKFFSNKYDTAEEVRAVLNQLTGRIPA